MARVLYGGSPADFTTDADGTIVPNATVTVWDSREGGTQVTDLLDMFGEAIQSVESDDDGLVVFFGPNNFDRSLWLDSGEGRRLLVRADPLPRTNIVIGSVTVGTPAAASTEPVDDAGDQVLNLTIPPVAPNSVGQAELEPNSVGRSELQNNAAGSDEIADNAIVARHVADGALPVAKVSGLAAVAKSGVYDDLDGNPTALRVGSETVGAAITATLGPVTFSGEQFYKYPTTFNQWYQVAAVGGDVRVKRGVAAYPNNPYGQEIATVGETPFAFQAGQGSVWIAAKTINATPASSWTISPITSQSGGRMVGRALATNAIQVNGSAYVGAVNCADYISAGGDVQAYANVDVGGRVITPTVDFYAEDGQAGVRRMTWDAVAGTVALGLGVGSQTLRLGQAEYVLAKAGAAITAGQVVAITGAQGGRVRVTPWTDGAFPVGVATNAAAVVGVDVLVLVSGSYTLGNTSAYAAGATLYAVAGGGVTTAASTAPVVGTVVTSAASGGVIDVRPHMQLATPTDASVTDASVAANANIAPSKIDPARVTFSNADFTIPASARMVAQVGTMSAPRTVTLPPANTVGAGYVVTVKDASGTVGGSNTLTVARAGSDLINGSASGIVIATAYAARQFVSTGSNGWTAIVTPATVVTGTTAGTVAAGDDARIVGAVQSSLVDAKGDLLAATADNTVARLAAPADGQVLVADSTQTAGWTSAAMGNLLPPNVANGSESGTVDGGFAAQSNCTLASSTTWSAQGSRSIAITCTASGASGVLVRIGGGAAYSATLSVPVVPGLPYTLRYDGYTAAAAPGSVMGRIYWWKADGTASATASVTGTYVTLAAATTQVMTTAVAPADAAFASFFLGNTGAGSPTWSSGDVWYVDRISFHAGAGGLWVPPGLPVPNLGTRANPANATQVQVWNPGNNTWITV